MSDTWISVNNPPKHFKDILGWDGYDYVICHKTMNENAPYDFYNNESMGVTIKFWQSLPKPPKKSDL